MPSSTSSHPLFDGKVVRFLHASDHHASDRPCPLCFCRRDHSRIANTCHNENKETPYTSRPLCRSDVFNIQKQMGHDWLTARKNIRHTNPIQNHDVQYRNFRTISIDWHAVPTILLGRCCCCSYVLCSCNFSRIYLNAAQIDFQNGPIADSHFVRPYSFHRGVPSQNRLKKNPGIKSRV